MSATALTDLLPQLQALPLEQLAAPTIPVGVYTQEAEDLLVWSQPDRDALQRAGIDLSLLEALPTRIGALRHAQSRWNAARFVLEDAQREWSAASPRGHELRDELLATLRFAFRRDPALLDRVRAVAEGASDPDMIQDLSDLALLARENSALVEAIGGDPELVAQAEAQAGVLARLLAAARSEGTTSEAKELRDRAYVLVKQAVDEVRAGGRYIHRKDPDRAAGYASDFNRSRNLRSRRKAQAEDAGNAPVLDPGPGE